MEKTFLFPKKCYICLSDSSDTIEIKHTFEKSGYREIIKTTYKCLIPVCKHCKDRTIKSRRRPYIVWIGTALISAIIGLTAGTNGFFVGAIIGGLIGMFIAIIVAMSSFKEQVSFERGTGNMIFKNIEYQQLFDEVNWPILKDQRIEQFYKSTCNAWANGQFPEYKNYYTNINSFLSLKLMLKNNIITEGSALRIFFEKFSPLESEFLVVFSDKGLHFILTNKRLLQWDGIKNAFEEIILAEVDSFQIDALGAKLTIKKLSGESIPIEKISYYPNEKLLSLIISRSRKPINVVSK